MRPSKINSKTKLIRIKRQNENRETETMLKHQQIPVKHMRGVYNINIMQMDYHNETSGN